MTPETLQALKASIKHWEQNARAETPEDVRMGSAHCALCAVFFDGGCGGCPVVVASGERLCRETPYGEAVSQGRLWGFGAGSGSAFRQAAQAEVDFLKSLLPDEEKAND